ncbi:hypothetical protein CLPU_1c02350 [Gottschalkia purinilytica]|uniref:Nucleoid-associated protein n=1 Tax=Gottschalkia purinilytica TaxID=1503 RepID=A0A0L0WF75_GOTPU|nr:nucleoid-associated protein [Gottschalkia purinilytica]KNF10070.1 hypothetical protein CLPU_1c02350 [Gottschalkia purinilytica]
MSETKEVFVEKLILHILDNCLGLPVLSEEEHPFDDDINEFMIKHIDRVFEDVNLKQAYFEDENNIVKKLCDNILEDNNVFIYCSKKFGELLYDTMLKNPDIPSADLVCSLFSRDGVRYLGLFIFTYKTSYIHYIEELETKRINKVIKQKTALPNENQKVEECVIINLEDYSMLLKEKKYEIDGEKQYYLSKKILKSEYIMSDKEKMDIINKASKRVIKEHYDGDITKIAEIKNIIVESVEDSNTVDIEEIKGKVFDNNPEMQNIYVEEIEKSGLTDKTITVSDNVSKKIAKKQRLVTDDGIEIKLPVSYLTRKDKVEFLNNQDGTVSILLKNIRDIKDK